MRLRQKHGRRSEVIAADFGGAERLGIAHVGVADDRQVLAIGFERASARPARVEGRAGLGGRPQILLHPEGRGAGRAVHHLDGHEPRRGRRRPRRRRRARGHHCFEERQRDRSAEPLRTVRRGSGLLVMVIAFRLR